MRAKLRRATATAGKSCRATRIFIKRAVRAGSRVRLAPRPGNAVDIVRQHTSPPFRTRMGFPRLASDKPPSDYKSEARRIFRAKGPGLIDEFPGTPVPAGRVENLRRSVDTDGSKESCEHEETRAQWPRRLARADVLSSPRRHAQHAEGRVRFILNVKCPAWSENVLARTKFSD